MPTTTDNEFAALVASYGAGLSLNDMRRKKWAGDLKTSMNDLEKQFYPGNDPWSLSEEEYKYYGGDAKNSLSDNQGIYNWSGGVTPPPYTGKLTFPSQASCDVLYAPTPTIVITTGSATTIAGGVLTAPSSPLFKYRGAGGFAFGVGFPLTTVYAPNSRWNNAFATPNNCGVSFMHTGTEFECMYYLASTSGSIRVRVDGQRVTPLPVQSLTPNGGRYMWKMTFGSGGTRRIDIDSGYNHFGGVYVAPGNSIAAVPAFNCRCLLFGDSIINGSVSTTGLANGTWKQLFDKYCGIDDIWDIAIGGTGYIARGSNPGTSTDALQVRINDVLNWAPDVLITWASYNDFSSTDAALRTAAQTLYASINTLPASCEKYVWGAWSPIVTQQGTYAAHDIVLKEEAAAAQLPIWFPATGKCYNKSGQQLASTEPIIRDETDRAAMIQGDLVHPTDAGNTRIAQVAQGAMKILTGVS